MKLKDGFVTYEMDGDQYLTAVSGFGGLVRGNATAAFIVNQLKTDTTEDAIVDAMAAEYDAPREQIAADVHGILDSLREIGAIDE